MPRGRPRTVEKAVCPDHPGSSVKAFGTRTLASGVVTRRYQCTPVIGKRHWFSTRLTPDQRIAAWSPPPPCPEHAGSKVVRNGTYGKSTPKPRQRYRCTPADGSKSHSFTPALPRDHVHENEEHCDHCEELRGIHHGETAVARRHTWSTRLVVRGLERLAAGASYAEVGRWAKRVAGVERTRATGGSEDEDIEEPMAKRKSEAAEEARRSWHIAADWVEAFSPVIYSHVDAELRGVAYADRARLDDLRKRKQTLHRPQVILLDDAPVYGKDLSEQKRRRDAGFFVLVLAEGQWLRDDETTARLRLVRAMPKSNSTTWRLLFDELGYTPDYIVADAGTGIVRAIKDHYKPDRTKFIPSLWHLSNRIDKDLRDVAGAHTVNARGGKTLVEPISQHFRLLHRGGALASQADWSAWWDELEKVLVTLNLPVDIVRRQRRYNEDDFAAIIDDLVTHPGLPTATGGLETLIAKHVQPQLAMKRTAFANAERTNYLFDLVVAAHHGVFDDPSTVMKMLRDDATPHGGWAVPLRAISDPRPKQGTYSSLRDITLVNDLAAQRGLL